MLLIQVIAITVIIYDLKILNPGFQQGIIYFRLISVHFYNVVLTKLFIICKFGLKWMGTMSKLIYNSSKLSYLTN